MFDALIGASSINALPIEILTRIFLIVSQRNRCHSDYLAQVCSRWRSVAIKCPHLWSHVDYSPHEFNTPGSRFYSRSRAELFVARSGGVPLEIHVMESHNHDDEDLYLTEQAKQFLRSVAPRMGALHVELAGTTSEEVIDLYQGVISLLISNSTPGHLTKLDIDYSIWAKFVPADDQDDNDIYKLVLPLSGLDLDNLFTPITALDLRGLYPRWSSPAYRGLVDLRLNSDMYEHQPMSELEFITILKASPKLRTLHFGYPITDRLQGDVSALRITLNDLEVLHVITNEPELELHDVLRLISPGPKPLSLAIRRRYRNEEDFVTNLHVAETKAFLARSRVEKLYTQYYSLSDMFFRFSPHLKVLILDKYKHPLAPFPPSNPHGDSTVISPPTVGYCYLLDCSLESSRLYSMIRQCSIQNILLVRCEFYSNGKKVSQEEAKQELCRICPTVEFTYSRARLASHRELFSLLETQEF